MTHTRLIGVGAFVIGGILLFAVGLFMIGNRRMLFVDRFQVDAEFAKVTGLQKGAIVRVSGMDAGEVETIRVPANPSSRFRVQMRVREDLHHLVRTDSIATIQTDGLVGNNFIQIEIGTDKAPVAAAGSLIQSREPFDFAALMEQASATVKTLDATVVQLRGDVEEALGAITDTAQQASAIIEDMGDDVKSITSNGQRIAKDIQMVTSEISAGRGTMGKLVKDDELYTRAASIAKEAEATVAQMRKTIEQARVTMEGLNTNLGGKNGAMQGMTSDLRQTMTYAREAMADLAENTESLKRNFLFRGLFRGRGFYDLDSIAPEEYRGGEFAGKDRVPLRIWLDAAVLFATDKDGNEELTPAGRQRLDSAMATFLKYPTKQMPFMVEGYARAATIDAAHLKSATRAVMVREYVVRRFALNPNTTGLMPLGLEAADSPRGDGTWDGVGLTLWMRRDLFAAPGTRAVSATR
jgi:phospholipid/cholesterol/gamma-HCH transport system substrate-binding protein